MVDLSGWQVRGVLRNCGVCLPTKLLNIMHLFRHAVSPLCVVGCVCVMSGVSVVQVAGSDQPPARWGRAESPDRDCMN